MRNEPHRSRHDATQVIEPEPDDRITQSNHRRGDVFFYRELCRTPRESSIDHIDVLRETFRKVKGDHPFDIDAMVVLPDHLHCVWTLRPGDADYKTRWALIKAGFSRAIPPGERRSASRMRRGERGVWQRRYWEHLIRDERDFERHVDYIHWNPVKHGWVERVRDWPYSTFHAYVRQGVYPMDWACEPDGAFDGEE